LTIACTEGTPRSNEFSGAVKFFDTIIAVVDHVHIAFGIEYYPSWII
jgi:hypothetical protein